MNNKKLLLSLFIATTVAAISVRPGLMVFAESEDGGASSGADSQNQIDSGRHGDSRYGTTTPIEGDKSDSNESDAESSRASTTAKTGHGESARHDSNQVGDRENSDTGTEVDVDHESALDATTTLESSDQVHNRGELRSYLNHLVKNDERVAEVQVSSTTVETRYALPARFMWSIPASIPAQVAVGADGSVTITYPWYAFLYSKQDDAIRNQLLQAASSTTGGGASTTLSASQQAHLLDEILSALKLQ